MLIGLIFQNGNREAKGSANLLPAVWRINGILFSHGSASAPRLLLRSTLEDGSEEAVNGPTSVAAFLTFSSAF